MKTTFWVLLAATISPAALGQIDYGGGAYSQDFDTLRSEAIYTYYTDLPVGWSVSAIRNSYVWTSVTNGYSDNYGVYCFSLERGAPDKSIGIVRGSTGPAHVGARFRNTSGARLTGFSLRYVGEQWRRGAVAASDQTIPFSYSLDATNLTSGTFVRVPALDLNSIHDGDGVAAAMNGNVASNRQLVAGTVSGISWLPDHDLWIRWSGATYPWSTAHALAIDDLSFRAVPELSISLSTPATLRLSWSTNDPGYSLQSADTAPATAWSAVTNMAVTAGGEFSVELEATDTQRFFRLKAQ